MRKKAVVERRMKAAMDQILRGTTRQIHRCFSSAKSQISDRDILLCAEWRKKRNEERLEKGS